MISRRAASGILACGFLGVIAVTTTGCAGGIGAVSDRSRDDARLAAEVKVVLVRDPELAAAAIDVTADDGTVRLSGFVETQAQRSRAQTLTAEVAGVRSVDNRLQVK